MATYELKLQQLHLLRDNLKTPYLKKIFEKTLSNSAILRSKKTNVSLEKNEVEGLLDELTFLLTEKGLGEDDEPNQFGLAIEDIIDVINPY